MQPKISRRHAIQLGVAGAGVVLSGVSSAAYAQTTKTPQPSIKTRSAWATNHPVKGTLQAEDDVRFLLVHHSASSNEYSADEVSKQIQSFYNFHTSSEKGWPDVAYNFFVDRFGTIWEARQGSIKGAVQGDATGGSQGHAMLCCFIGNHQEKPISPEAKTAMTQLLAWLADTYNVETEPNATVSFTSRGSNKWPAGETVTTRTIAAHREMSLTTCPGDFAFATIKDELPKTVTQVRNSYTSSTSSTTTVQATSTSVAEKEAESTTAPETTISKNESTTSAAPSVSTSTRTTQANDSRNSISQNTDNQSLYIALGASGGAVAAITAAAVLHHKKKP